MKAPTHMTDAELEAYRGWLYGIARRARGRVKQFLTDCADACAGSWDYVP